MQNIEAFNPDLKSVFKEIEEGHYLFVVADAKKAFLFLFNKGKLESSKEFMHTDVKKLVKTDSGELYGRNDKLARHIENQLHDHLKLIIHEVEVLIKGQHLNGVFIGGHKVMHHKIQAELSKDLQAKFRAAFVTELNIPRDELLGHCIQVLNSYSTHSSVSN